MIRRVGQLASKAARGTGTDRATTWALVLRAWSVIAGPTSLLIISHFFTVETQGYYYTFASVIALQLFAELGLAQVLTQFASHEWVHLRLDARRQPEGAAEHLSRLASLVRFAGSWYAAGALLLLLVLLAAGLSFFGAGPAAGGTVPWRAAWIALVVVTSLNFALLPAWAILSGCGEIAAVNAFRAGLGVAMNVAGWVAIAAGAGLFAAVVSGAISLAGGVVFLGVRYGAFLGALLRHRGAARIDWRHELLPMQARIAISALTSYFMYYLFTPVLFRYQGAESAARMGMSMAVATALSSLAGAWVETKAPVFGMLVARQDYGALDEAFRKATLTSMVVAGLGGVAAWVLFVVLLAHHPLGRRVLPAAPLALLFLVVVANQGIAAFNTYLRAHRQEPTMPVSVAVNLVCGLSTWYLGARHGALGAMVGYAVIVIGVQLPVVWAIWKARRREWHAAPTGGAGGG